MALGCPEKMQLFFWTFYFCLCFRDLGLFGAMFKKNRGFPNLTDHVYDGDAYAAFWIVGWAHIGSDLGLTS